MLSRDRPEHTLRWRCQGRREVPRSSPARGHRWLRRAPLSPGSKEKGPGLVGGGPRSAEPAGSPLPTVLTQGVGGQAARTAGRTCSCVSGAGITSPGPGPQSRSLAMPEPAWGKPSSLPWTERALGPGPALAFGERRQKDSGSSAVEIGRYSCHKPFRWFCSHF